MFFAFDHGIPRLVASRLTLFCLLYRMSSSSRVLVSCTRLVYSSRVLVSCTRLVYSSCLLVSSTRLVYSSRLLSCLLYPVSYIVLLLVFIVTSLDNHNTHRSALPLGGVCLIECVLSRKQWGIFLVEKVVPPFPRNVDVEQARSK